MAAVNEHTYRMITTAIKTTTDAYREGWERIFGKKGAEHLVADDIDKPHTDSVPCLRQE